ncbi:MAG: Rrf2 family transcriptional regulator [Rikenellaceae bacterium]
MYKQSSKDIFKVLPAIIKAHENGKERVSAVDLGELFDVNHRTLNVTLQKLVHAGILYSQRGGRNPGYGFARAPKRVSLYDISQVISFFEYPRCSFKEHDDDENCVACNILSVAFDRAIDELKNVNCYDYYLSMAGKK